MYSSQRKSQVHGYAGENNETLQSSESEKETIALNLLTCMRGIIYQIEMMEKNHEQFLKAFA